jgi:hypothetical protein
MQQVGICWGSTKESAKKAWDYTQEQALQDLVMEQRSS